MLLATREFANRGLEAGAEAQSAEHGGGAIECFGRGNAVQEQRHRDISLHGEVTKEMKRLEGESDQLTAKRGGVIIIETDERAAGDLHTPRVGGLETGNDVEQGGFAAARLTKQCNPLSRLGSQCQILEDDPLAEALVKCLEQDGRRRLPLSHSVILRSRPRSG